jgi:apolipoprotein N-acyltransferase
MRNSTFHKCGLAIASSFLLTASFPKFGLFYVAWFALVPLLIAIRDLSSWNRFRLGFLTGLVHYFTLGYWLIHTLRTYGHLPIYVCLPIFFLLGAYLACYMGVFCIMLGKAGRKPVISVFLIPVLWVALEYLRAFALTGVPWEFLGHSQFRNPGLIQISDLVGVYGISFLIALANGIILMAILGLTQQKWFDHAVFKSHLAAFIIIFAILMSMTLFYGQRRIQSIDRQIATAPLAKVAVIQGNIDQALKWDARFQLETTLKYIRLSHESKRQQPDLVIWPETATPFYFQYNKELSQRVINGIIATGADFLIGSPSFQRKPESVDYYNSAYLIRSDGTISGKYDKTHLVPFGEYVPWGEYLPFLGKLVEQVGDFKAGVPGKTLPWRNHHIGVLICYELMFPTLARTQVNNKADLLINITNDAWYGDTAAPFQHFSIAVFRAVENRRSLIRAANTGISGFIDPAGRIIAPTPLFVEAIAVQSVPVIREKTFYTRHGDLFAQICLALSLFVVIVQISLKFRNKRGL